MKLILTDDERIARARLRRLLEKEPDVEIVAECSDGPDTIEAVGKHGPDLLLLDIQMPGMDGFQVFESLEHPPLVIFVTAYDEYAIRAFEASALDYLLKPVAPERLGKALHRVRSRMADRQAATVRQQSLPSPPQRPARFTIRDNDRITIVPIEEIDWVEAAGNYAILHVGPKNHILRQTMGTLESQLSPEAFLRVSRSTILNLRRVKELQSEGAEKVFALLGDGQRIAVTKGLREVQKRLGGA
jgi:two-component system LytT family response regulator